MSALDWLKQIMTSLREACPALVTVNNVRVNIVQNSGPAFTASEDGQVTLNIGAMDPSQADLVRGLTQNSFDETGKILHAKTEGQAEDYLEATAEDVCRDLLLRLKDAIPPEDIELLKAALYVMARHLNGKPVSEIKQQVFRSYGQRGRNLANLCSAGYLETLMLPKLDELWNQHDPGTAIEKFRIFWCEIIRTLPWSVFVNHNDNASSVAAQIGEKLDRNRQYGIQGVNVHGLGLTNVSAVDDAVISLRANRPDILVSSMDRTATSIFVRFMVKPPEIPPTAGSSSIG